MRKEVSVDYKIYEPRVGVLTHEVFYFGSGIEIKNHITIFKANSESTFGDEVFSGSLETLIESITMWQEVTA